MDTTGNLYGVCYAGGAYGCGMVFELTNSRGVWSLIDLHDFDCSDGADPIGAVVFDASGNLYGTASNGGAYHYGVVWEITP